LFSYQYKENTVKHNQFRTLVIVAVFSLVLFISIVGIAAACNGGKCTNPLPEPAKACESPGGGPAHKCTTPQPETTVEATAESTKVPEPTKVETVEATKVTEPTKAATVETTKVPDQQPKATSTPVATPTTQPTVVSDVPDTVSECGLHGEDGECSPCDFLLAALDQGDLILVVSPENLNPDFISGDGYQVVLLSDGGVQAGGELRASGELAGK
jgi:hypothetical protein